MGKTVKGVGGNANKEVDGTSDTIAATDIGEAVAPSLENDKTLALGRDAQSAPRNDGATPGDHVPTVRSPSNVSSGALRALEPVPKSYYEFLSEYGRGGLGKISEARDLRTGRIVAIKEMLPSAKSANARFAREAVITANLQHPAIVPVYEVGVWEEDGGPFYAMKLVAGKPLETVLREATSPSERLALLPQLQAVAEAIAYAHSEGVVHRDLKPANVLVGDFGETVVIDWGLAKRKGDADESLPAVRASTADGLTLDGDIMGTPAYMSPEQARGGAVDETSDVFAIGVMLYELFAGKVPFAGMKTLADLLHAVRDKTPPPIARVAPHTPPDLVAIIEKAMARSPKARYASGQGLAEDLRKFQMGKLVGARQYSSTELFRRWLRKHRLAVAMSSITAASLAVGGIVSVRRIVRERQVAVSATKRSSRSLAAAYTQMAIRQLDRGRSLRALTYVSEAADLGTSLSPTDRLVAGMAVLPLEPLAATVVGNGEPLLSLFEIADGSSLVAATKRELRWYNTDSWEQVSTTKLSTDLRAATFLPDGRFLAITEDAALYAPGGAKTLIAEGVLSSWVSANGASLLLATRDGDVSVHALDKALTEERRWKAGEQPIWRLAGNRTSDIIATDADDVVLWDAQSSEELGRIEASAYPVFSPDGARVLTISEYGYGTQVQITDARTGALLRNLDHGAEAVTSALFTADGTAVVTTAGEVLRWWDAETGETLGQRNVGEDPWLVGTTAELGCITANRRGRILVHTMATSIPLHASGAVPSAVTYNLAEGRLISAARDGNVYRWQLPPLARYVSPPEGSDEVREVFYPAGAGPMLVVGNTGSAELLDPESGATLAHLADNVEIGAFSQDGALLALLHDDGTVTTRPVKAPQEVATISTHDGDGRIVALVASPHGRYLAIVDSENRIEFWELASSKNTSKKAIAAAPGSLIKCLEFSRDETQAVACSADGQNTLFQLASGEATTVGTKHLWTNAAAFSRSGDNLVLAGNVKPGEEGAVLVASARGTEVRQLAATGTSASVARFSPGGGRMVLGLADHMEVWDAERGALIATLPTVGDLPIDIAFDPGEELLLTAFESGDLAVWDIASGVEVMRTSWGREASLALRGDAKQAIIQADGKAIVWNRPHFTGTRDELERLAHCYSAWRIKDGAQILAKAAPEDCQ